MFVSAFTVFSPYQQNNLFQDSDAVWHVITVFISGLLSQKFTEGHKNVPKSLFSEKCVYQTHLKQTRQCVTWVCVSVWEPAWD